MKTSILTMNYLLLFYKEKQTNLRCMCSYVVCLTDKIFKQFLKERAIEVDDIDIRQTPANYNNS